MDKLAKGTRVLVKASAYTSYLKPHPDYPPDELVHAPDGGKVLDWEQHFAARQSSHTTMNNASRPIDGQAKCLYRSPLAHPVPGLVVGWTMRATGVYGSEWGGGDWDAWEQAVLRVDARHLLYVVVPTVDDRWQEPWLVLPDDLTVEVHP